MINVNFKEFMQDLNPILWGFVVCVFLSILVEIITDEIKRYKKNT